MIVEGTTTAGTKICATCLQSYPAQYLHYCAAVPRGPPLHTIRGFSEDEIRQIVRDEIAKANVDNEPA